MFTAQTDAYLTEKLAARPRVLCERSLKYDIDDLLRQQFEGASFAVIDDSNTAAVLGDHVARALPGASRLTLPGLVKADDKAVQDVLDKSSGADVLLAVGGGTINDLCKYAAYKQKKPYAVFPTAASMNGYLSANASITQGGHKTTLPAQMPAAVFCDMAVIASAPARLAKSGLGDAIARSTAQADWLLSHLLLGTAYDESVFGLLAPLEPQLHAQARGIALGDSDAIGLLLHSLLLSGLGMTIAGGSYPASQGEHMIAHSCGMLGGASKEALHGEEIAVTTLYMAKRQERLLRGDAKLLDTLFDARMERLFGKKLAQEFKAEYDAKRDQVLAHDVQQQLREGAEAVMEKMQPVFLPPAHMAKVLEAAQCQTHPESVGWTNEAFATACELARFTRSRFTFLDLSPDLRG